MTLISVKQKPYRQKKKVSSKSKSHRSKSSFRRIIVAVPVLVAMLSFTAVAANIGADDAKRIALEDAGYSAHEVEYIRAAQEYEDGKKVWNVEFHVEAKGGYKEYDYEISASDGRILERDADFERAGGEEHYESRFEKFVSSFIAWILSFFR